MVVTSHDGHTIPLSSGTKVHVEAKFGENTGPWIMLTTVNPYGTGEAASLDPDSALKLATAILRELSLARFGVG